MLSKGKKWTLVLWGMILGSLIAGVAMVGWWIGKDGAQGVLGQGLGLVTLIFGGYATANVKQKQYIGQNYRAELDDKRNGNE